jgi:hypothetical protein
VPFDRETLRPPRLRGHWLRHGLVAVSFTPRLHLSLFLYLNPGQPRTLLQLNLVGILTINLFLT